MRQAATVAGTNLEQAKSHNRRVVIEAVRINGALSRAEIARLTALSSQTISNIVGRARGCGHPEGVGPRARPAAASRQRPSPSIPTAPIPSACSSTIAMLVGVVVDLAGRIRARASRCRRPARPRQRAARHAAPGRQASQDPARIDPDADLLGIGACHARALRRRGHHLRRPHRPSRLAGFSRSPPSCSALTGLPTIVENDATAAAIGERLHGVARHLDSFVYLFIGTGLGAGLFLGGHLFKGSAHNAGEIGHMIVEPERPPLPLRQSRLPRALSLAARGL